MAKRAKASERAAERGRRRRHGRAARPDPARRLIAAALSLAESKGWATVSISDIAAKAGVPVEAARAIFPSKAALLVGFIRRIDEAVLAAGPASGDSPRDRLFEILMRRYDGLAPNKAAVKAIVRDLGRDPMTSLCVLAALFRSMAAMVEAAGLSAEGLPGAARAAGLGLANGIAMRTWLGDATPDMSKTMAALDQALGQAQSLAQIIDISR